MKIFKKIVAVVFEIVQTVLILCWVLYSPIYTCMLAYNAACYVNYGKAATPYIVIVVATLIFIVNIIWLNRIDNQRKEEKKNG